MKAGLSVSLGFLFVGLATFNVITMLQGSRTAQTPRTRARAIDIHRVGGYLFIGLFAVMVWFMSKRLMGSPEGVAGDAAAHIDLAILGGLEVACTGDLANWTVPGKMITGMGGAMDLAAGARRVVVLQSHAAKDGKPKLVRALSLPATAVACVHRVITELGAFDVGGDHFVCVDRAPGIDQATITRSTGAPVRFA